MESRHICASCDHCSIGGNYCYRYSMVTGLENTCSEYKKIKPTKKETMRTYKKAILTMEERRKLESMIDCYTWNEIAAEFGSSVSHITRCAQRYGIVKPSRYKYTPEVLEDIKRRMAAGQMPHEIAKHLGVEAHIINSVISNNHLPRMKDLKTK